MTRATVGGINSEDNLWYPLAVNSSGQAEINLDSYTNINNESTTSERIFTQSLVVSLSLQSARPSDVWSSASFYGINNLGQIYTPGSYAVALTSGGYRNDQGKWTSFWNSEIPVKGAAQVVCVPSGAVIIGTNEVKSSGTEAWPTSRLEITDNGTKCTGAFQAQELICRKSGGGYAQIVVLQDGTVVSTDVPGLSNVARIDEIVTDTP